MSASATAEIIQFPTRTAALAAPGQDVPAQVTPSPEEARLGKALAGLNEALIAQRTAMTAWKSALGDLRTVTNRLGTSLHGYNHSLSRLNDRVATLRADAVKLQTWADDALSRKT
jgi:hypothetical protein